MRRQKDAIQYGNSMIGYAIIRSAERSTVAVTVHPDGSVDVAAPRGIRRDKLAEVVLKKANWILQQQEYFRRQSAGLSKKFVSGESFPYLGRQYKLKVRRRSGLRVPTLQLVKGEFVVTVSSEVETDKKPGVVKDELTKWYRRRAQDNVISIVERFAAKLGVVPDVVYIRDMQKRWGSGGRSRRLAFNWRIIMAPRRLVEYVVAHELCHLVHDDHSRDFWRLLEKVMPDYERRRQALAVAGAKYDLRSE